MRPAHEKNVPLNLLLCKENAVPRKSHYRSNYRQPSNIFLLPQPIGGGRCSKGENTPPFFDLLPWFKGWGDFYINPLLWPKVQKRRDILFGQRTSSSLFLFGEMVEARKMVWRSFCLFCLERPL